MKILKILKKTHNRRISILIVALIMSVGYTFAHEDFFVIKKFGNVHVRIQTGFLYEEINNVALLGQLAEKLCEKYNFSQPVLLDFIHYYAGNYSHGLFVSFEKVTHAYLWGDHDKAFLLDDNNVVVFKDIESFPEGDALVIRQVANHFQAQTTMKLLEYAIRNHDTIKSSQKQIVFESKYSNMYFNSIDTLTIQEMLNTPNSDLLNSTLNIRVDRPEKDAVYGFSYYLQNNRYYVYQKDYGDEYETALIDLEHIYDFKRTGEKGNMVVFFDSDSSFYYAGRINRFSKRHVIDNLGSYHPFDIAYIGDEKITICFWYWKTKREEDEVGDSYIIGDQQRIMLYKMDEDRLIPNLNKVLKKL
jgi:hypothetical protein